MFIYVQMLLRKISNNRGIFLVAVVIVMVIAAALALLVASFMSSGNIAAVTDMQSEQAFYLAQAGIGWYLERLQGDNNWSGSGAPTVKTNQAFGSGTFSVTYTNNSKDDIDIAGIGKVTAWDGNTVQRVVRCHVTRTGITISSWREYLQ